MKLGKLPARPEPHQLTLAQFENLAAAEIPEAQPGFGHYQLVPHYGTLGNDRYGDCVFAGADHETIMWNAEHGRTVRFTDQNALADYAAVTGFNPATGEHDDGTYVPDALSYRRHTGVIDSTGKRHRIGAYLAIEPGNWDHVLQALYAFNVVAVGFEFPASAMTQFNAGKPWTYVRGSKIEGGHYVPVVGRPGWNYLDVVTWGKVQTMSRHFFGEYVDEAYAIVSPEMLKRGGTTLEGFDLAGLNAALAELG